MLSEADKKSLVSGYNDTEVIYPPESSVIGLFRKMTLLYGTFPAMRLDGQELSYAQLDRLSGRMAAYLQQSHGIGNGSVVALLMGRSFQMVISTLAVLKSGAACVPLNNSYPADRIGYILENSDASLLITDKDDEIVSKHAVIISVHRYDDFLYADVDNPINGAPSLSGTAYIIYTSGSTGKPKGVMLSHENILDYVFTFIAYFHAGTGDRMLHHSSLAFDTGVEEILVTLCSGALLVISPGGGQDMESLSALIQKERITLISATPLLIGELNVRAGDSTTLRAVISGGEELKAYHIDRLAGITKIYNTYGPTETSVCATFHKVSCLAEASLIGRPIANRLVYLLDDDLKPVPHGEAGEICISGKGVGQGYVKLPDLNARKFIPDPARDGERMFRSGDMARWTKEDVLEFLGRKDEQVKINGFRVEPAEVEIALRAHQLVRGVIVLSKEVDRNRVLLAFYRSEALLDEKELHDLLSNTLPAYMIPSRFIRVDHFPLLTNGKLDKKSLLEMDLSHSRFEKPSTVVEEELEVIWRSILGERNISMHANFFEAGGNSVKAVYLQTALESRFPGVFTIADIFDHTSIRKQAGFILKKQGPTNILEQEMIKEIEL